MDRIIVIGSGPSGLTAAIKAKSNKNNITILEKNNISGKKLLITGNGKCNYMNEDFTISHYNSTNINTLETIINKEGKNKILDFFNELGILPKIKNGYYYPFSNQAITVRESLVKLAEIKGINIKYNEEVLNIDYINNEFIIKTNNNTYTCDKLVISTGGNTYPTTGSTGFAYKILPKFNHTVISPLPALTPIYPKQNILRDSKGVRTETIINMYENNKLIDTSTGELQITDKTLSGICIFQLSGRIIRSIINKNKITVGINFLPTLDIADINTLVKFLDNRNLTLKQRNISELLDGLLNYKLVNNILKINKIDRNNLWNSLTNKEKEDISKSLIDLRIEIDNSYSYDSAQVTSGGIPLTEINIETMESLKQKNLYLTGELLDVDGACGGYNLAFSWLSGIIAGNHINNN